MAPLKSLNLAARFLLELCLLGALGWVGFQLGGPMIAKVALATILPLGAAIIWGMYIAPRARFVVPHWLWLAIQILLFGAAVAGLALIGQRQLAIAFGLAVIVNIGLILIWGQHRQ